jgi:hypothetical protein
MSALILSCCVIMFLCINRASLGVRLVGKLVNDKTVPQGAATTVWAALAPVVATAGLRGAYLSDCAPIPPSVPAAMVSQNWNIYT